MKRLCLILLARSLYAHNGERLEPHDLATAWAFDPGVVIPLLLSAWFYYFGLSRSRHSLPRANIWAFTAGWITLVLALMSPLHPLGESLFSAHMVQHEMLMLVAAPLLVLGHPLVPFLWALPFEWRRAAGRLTKAQPVQAGWSFLTNPLVAWIIGVIVLWGWHMPVLFQLTLRSELAHAAQHICFLGSALLFWWAVFRGGSERMSYGMSVLYIFTTAIHSGILGALLALSPRIWYPAYAGSTATWGLTPLEDQQLGGLVMWVPASIVYIAAALWLFVLWMRESEFRMLHARAGDRV